MELNHLLLIGILTIIIWFAVRELNCWYWKINRRIELQEETNELLKEILNRQPKLEQPKSELKGSVSQTSVNDMDVLNSVIDKLNEKK